MLKLYNDIIKINDNILISQLVLKLFPQLEANKINKNNKKPKSHFNIIIIFFDIFLIRTLKRRYLSPVNRLCITCLNSDSECKNSSIVRFYF